MCSACGCNGPNQICDVKTGMCECPENTVGRTCLPCQCNNNTNRCLRTGECLGCQFNTTGFSCQHCASGSFGNALNQQCYGKTAVTNSNLEMHAMFFMRFEKSRVKLQRSLSKGNGNCFEKSGVLRNRGFEESRFY